MARTKTLKVGSVLPIDVTKEWIEESVPCDKGLCMLTLATISTLDERFGAQNYNVKSTNHGLTFDINGYRILCVFDHNTSDRIYKYDEIFMKTGSMEKARASIRPFRSKLMVESCQKAPKYPPMSAATKTRLKSMPRKKKFVPKAGLRSVNRRQLSM
jgi:hypothetical protein